MKNTGGMSNLGKNVRFLRKQMGLTLEELALKSELDTSNLSRLERGLGGYSREGIARLCDALGVSEGILFSDGVFEDNPPLNARRIPILSDIQAAKWSASTVKPPEANIQSLFIDLKAGRHSFAIGVQGEAMLPLFVEHDVVIADPEVKPHPGDFVVATVDLQPAILRQYRVAELGAAGEPIIELVPMSTFHPTISSATHKIRIIGTMIEHRRFRKKRS